MHIYECGTQESIQIDRHGLNLRIVSNINSLNVIWNFLTPTQIETNNLDRTEIIDIGINKHKSIKYT